MASWLSRLRRRIRARWRMLRYGNSEDGTYRFVVRRWDRLPDLDLAAAVCSSEFFATNLVPKALSLEGITSLAVLAPHPDDEAIGCGGLMLHAQSLGIPVRVLFLTDGLNVRNPPIEDPDAFRAMRRAEAQRALAFAGAEMAELGLDNVRPAPTRAHLQALAEFVKADPTALLCAPWLLDNPAKHRMTHHLLSLADRVHGLGNPELCQYQVHNMLIPNAFLEITNLIDRKEEMIRSYESQIPRTPYDHFSRGLSAWNARFLPRAKARERYAELFHVLPLQASLELVRRFYLKDLQRTYRSVEAVAQAMAALEAEVARGPTRR